MPPRNQRMENTGNAQVTVTNGLKVTRIEKVFVHKTGHVIPPHRKGFSPSEGGFKELDATENTAKGFGDEAPSFFGK